MKIKDINTALTVFENSAKLHETSTENGDYKMANKSHAEIMKVLLFLKKVNKVETLDLFLEHDSLGVKSWAALFLLPIFEQKAIDALEEVAKDNGIRGFAAKTTLSEWRKGNLKL